MNTCSIPIALFRLGRLLVTPNVLEKVAREEIRAAIAKHQAGDWGDLCEQEREANMRALERCTRVCSKLISSQGVAFYLITEADRSITTILLPEEY